MSNNAQQRAQVFDARFAVHHAAIIMIILIIGVSITIILLLCSWQFGDQQEVSVHLLSVNVWQVTEQNKLQLILLRFPKILGSTQWQWNYA